MSGITDNDKISALEERIGYSFKNRELLLTALTHSSYANERRGGCECYERLEFLGDSVLGFVTAGFLYRVEPKIPEGRMTRLRAELVCEQNLHGVALTLGIRDCMRLGRGEETSGGRDRVSVLADMVESIIAAIYLDSDLSEAGNFIYRFILNRADISEYHDPVDYTTELQEFLQRGGVCDIVYEEVSESGPDHNKSFEFRVLVNGEETGKGSGKTKKEARRFAAAAALERLKQ